MNVQYFGSVLSAKGFTSGLALLGNDGNLQEATVTGELGHGRVPSDGTL